MSDSKINKSSIFSKKEGKFTEVLTLDKLVERKNEQLFEKHNYYEHQFNRFYRDFSKSRYEGYVDREELLESVSTKTGSVYHRVKSKNGEPLKVHHFGEIIEVTERDYVTRSGILFDPTIMEEGKSSSFMVDDYISMLRQINQPNELDIHIWDKGEWLEYNENDYHVN